MLISEHTAGGHTAFGNSATLAAIHGDPDLAVQYLRKAIELSEGKSASEVKLTKTIYTEMLNALSSPQTHKTVRSWAGTGGSVAGPVAKDRMKVFHGRCQMTLIWF